MRAWRCFVCGMKREDRSDFGSVHRNGVRIPLCHPGDSEGATCYTAWSGFLGALSGQPPIASLAGGYLCGPDHASSKDPRCRYYKPAAEGTP